MENQFNVGDLVWAKVDRHPWWPSIIYHEALTSDEARQAKKEGCVLVSFFGDNSYLWLDPKKLLHFESNYSVYSNRSRPRLFVKAINEAVYEVKHRAAIGMTCPCVFFASYRPSHVEGLLKVDLAGYQSGGDYTVQQIERFRQEFRPVETLSFVQQLALDPTNVTQDINSLKEVARVLAFRKARYAEVDEPYFLAFGVTPIRPGDPIVASNNREISLFQDPSEAEIPCQKKPKVKRQNKNKKRLAHLKDKEHVAKPKRRVKRYRRHDSKTTNSRDHVPQKKRRAKFEVEKKLDFISASDDKKQSPFKEPSMSKDHKEVKSLSTTTKSNGVHFVEEVQSSDTLVQDLHFVEKVQSCDTSKTQRKHKDSLAASKKRQRSKEWEMALASSPLKKRKKAENSTTVKEPQQGPNANANANASSDLEQEETPVTPPHDPVTSRSASVCRIQRLSEEIHARYWQQKGQTREKVNQGSVDISEKLLYLLKKCSRIVLESKGF